MFAQVVNSLILKVKDIAIFATNIFIFFQKLDRSAKSVMCMYYKKNLSGSKRPFIQTPGPFLHRGLTLQPPSPSPPPPSPLPPPPISMTSVRYQCYLWSPRMHRFMSHHSYPSKDPALSTDSPGLLRNKVKENCAQGR